MKRNELLKLNFLSWRELWNWHQLYRHELFTLLFIEKDGEIEVFEWDRTRLGIVRQFEEHERRHLEKTHPTLYNKK